MLGSGRPPPPGGRGGPEASKKAQQADFFQPGPFPPIKLPTFLSSLVANRDRMGNLKVLKHATKEFCDCHWFHSVGNHVRVPPRPLDFDFRRELLAVALRRQLIIPRTLFTVFSSPCPQAPSPCGRPEGGRTHPPPGGPRGGGGRGRHALGIRPIPSFRDLRYLPLPPLRYLRERDPPPLSSRRQKRGRTRL